MIAVTMFLQHLVDRLRDDEAGQSSVEYLGIVVVAATIVLLLIGAAAGWGGQITTAIGNKITEIAGS